MVRTWISHVLLTAASTTTAEVVANRPGVGALFGIAYSLGQEYMDLEIENWEVGKTRRGAGMLGPIVVGLALTTIFNASDRDGLLEKSRIRIEYPCPDAAVDDGANGWPWSLRLMESGNQGAVFYFQPHAAATAAAAMRRGYSTECRTCACEKRLQRHPALYQALMAAQFVGDPSRARLPQ